MIRGGGYNKAEEERRNLIFISDVLVTVDFFHTDMLERVISIKKANLEVEKKEED